MSDAHGDGEAEAKVMAARPHSTAINGGELLSTPGTGAAPRQFAQLKDMGGHVDLGNDDVYSKALSGRDRLRQQPEQKTESQIQAINKGVSPELAGSVQNALDTLPPKVKQQLKDQGVQVYAFKNIGEYDQFFGTHKANELVDGQRRAAQEAASLNDVNAHPPRIAIFEKTMNGESIAKFEDVGGLTRHELGHVLTNKIMPDLTKPNGGVFDEQLAMNVMNEGAKVPDALRKGVLSHYFHGGVAEIYAETFAMSTGGGSTRTEDAVIQQFFPKTLAKMRELYGS